MEAPAPRHPVRLVVADDLARSRLTVFFRLLLVIPHLLWLFLWGTVALVLVVVSWFATLFKGQTPDGLHGFLAEYLRYWTQVTAYSVLAASPYPPFFLGTAGSYPIDLEVDPPAPQNRWKTAFRLFLALPALLLTGGTAYGSGGLMGLATTAAFLVWFAALARGAAPRGLRDVAAWGIGYGAQAGAYVMLLTDRYPYAGWEGHLAELPAPEVDERLPALVNEDDLHRSRLTVLLRLPLAVPHLVWLVGWGVLAVLAMIANWFGALAVGHSPRPLARFLAAYVRYTTHVSAFLLVVGNPFPGFVGAAGSYPVDVRIDPFHPQNRWVTAFRPILAVPAMLMAAAAGGVVVVVALLGWFVALFTGRMPAGLQHAGAYALGYVAQTNAYSYVLTDRYPHASPQAVFVRRLPATGAAESLDSEPPGAFV